MTDKNFPQDYSELTAPAVGDQVMVTDVSDTTDNAVGTWKWMSWLNFLGANLAALFGLTSAADKLPYFTGSGTAAVTDLTAAARTVLDDTTVAAMLSTMGGAPLASPTFTGTVVLPSATVTSAMLRNSTALTVVGRSANSTGVPADIAASAASGAVLRESGSTLGFGTVATAGIADAAITSAKLANMAQSTVKGRAAAAGTGVPVDLTAAQLLTIISGMDLITAQSVTAGIKKTLQADATNAGLRLAGVTADPSTLVAGDLWYRSDTEKISYRGASAARLLVAEALSQPLTNKKLSAHSETSPSASVSGAVTRDYNAGSYQALTLTANVTSLTVSNWPASGEAGTITFVVTMAGFTWAHPSGTTWAGGAAPTMSGTSVVTYISRDGGTTKRGYFGGAAFA